MEVVFEGYKLRTLSTEIGSLALLRKVVEERLQVDQELVSKMLNDEDLALSWLESIARNYGVDVARVRIHLDGGTIVEYGTSTIRAPRVATIHPVPTKVSRIDIVKHSMQGSGVDRELKLSLQDAGNTVTPIVPEEDLYVFESPVTDLALQSADIVIHTDSDTILLDSRTLNEITSVQSTASTKTRASSSKTKKRKRKSRKRRRSRKSKRRRKRAASAK